MVSSKGRIRWLGCECAEPCPATICIHPKHEGAWNTPWCRMALLSVMPRRVSPFCLRCQNKHEGGGVAEPAKDEARTVEAGYDAETIIGKAIIVGQIIGWAIGGGQSP